MSNYIKPVIVINDGLAEGVYAASGSNCLSVTSWNDGMEGTNVYKVVFRVTHLGHQSYGQTIQATMSTDIKIHEAPSDVTATANGTVLTIVRNNQLNDSGLTEIWMKLTAETQPSVISVVASDCVQ